MGPMNDIAVMRVMNSFLSRVRSVGQGMFGGKRDFYEALGYARELTYDDYLKRYERGDIAGSIVDSYPNATWQGGAEVIEDATPKVWTPFEEDAYNLMNSTNMWSVFKEADILLGHGRYAIVVIGAPGFLHEELRKGKPGEIVYLNAYGEGNAKICAYDEDEQSPRYCWPIEYEITGTEVERRSKANQKNAGRKVHWTRVIHIADSSGMYSAPRLERVWNRLDDLEKVVGGGSEAFWKTVFQGMQIDVDKDMEITPEAKAELQAQVDEFEHGMRRVMRTRGVKVTSLGAATSDFGTNADTLLDLIAGAVKIPKRLLLGSERGELASTQDRENWHERVTNRRTQFAGPRVVHPLFDRMIEYGYVRKPKGTNYWVVWPKLGLTLTETSTIAATLAGVNEKMLETVVTGADIRDKVLGWDPLQGEDLERDPEVEEMDPVKQREREQKEADAASREADAAARAEAEAAVV